MHLSKLFCLKTLYTGARDITKRDNPQFSLVKWYLDCVSTDGNVIIGYAATLTWNKLKLNYANVLHYSDNGAIDQKTCWKKHSFPVIEDHSVVWTPENLPITGTWKSIDAPITRTLIETDSGFIKWDCIQPRAWSNITFCGKKISNALGYTEKLQLTIRPWELDINELRWGRFLSEEDTLIWIQWEGALNLNLLFYNQQLFEDAIITNESIQSIDGKIRLDLGHQAELKKGTLQNSLFGNTQEIYDFFPEKILRVRETKWRSNGVLHKENKSQTYGWVIHEVVQWKQKTIQS